MRFKNASNWVKRRTTTCLEALGQTSNHGGASKKQILQVLEQRYDYYSARVILDEVLESTQLTEVKDFEKKELSKVIKSLKAVGDRLDVVLASLKELSSGSATDPPTP